MPREHRVLDPKTGEMDISPFTAEEEVVADQQDADRVAAKAIYDAPDSRINRAFTLSDKDRVIFKMLFDNFNEIRLLKGLQIVSSTQFKDLLKTKLP